ncbi:CoA transferase, partial [Bordetella petrii]|uniref:CoA transferase n=1 Tax=Bordetella petrii TaxID=94624 RepID=UPI001E2B1522
TVGGKPQVRSAEPHAHVYIRSPYGVFATRDGYLALAMPDMRVLAQVLEEPRLLDYAGDNDGWDHRDTIFVLVRDALAGLSTDDAFARLNGAGIWCGPVYGYADLVADPQIAHNGTFVEYEHPTEGKVKTPGFPIRFSRTPARVERGAPLTGQHTDEVLGEFGYSAEQIARFEAEGAVLRGESA